MQRRHAVLPGTTSGPTMPIASPAVTARCGIRSLASCMASSPCWCPTSMTRSGRLTRTGRTGRLGGAGRLAGVVRLAVAGRLAMAGPLAVVGLLAVAGGPAAPESVSARTNCTCPMPEELRILTTARPIRRSPSILMTAARRLASARAPPSPSRWASDVVASSAASLARSGAGRARNVLAGKSSSAPPAASRVRTRSVAATGIPCSDAAAMTCPRSRLPSSRPIRNAA